MRQLLPEPIDHVDPVALYAADDRPPPAGRPWILVNMIASVDGATVVDGVSGPLGGPADKVVFGAVRGVADAILVGAGTVRAERYGPARPRGDRPGPRIAVVTASGDLDPELRLFTERPEGAPPPLVITCRSCPADRRATLAEVAELLDAGEDRVDVDAAVRALGDHGARVVVAEGGPSLNGQLVGAGLVDEWCASLAPVLAGGTSPRAAVGPPPVLGPTTMRLARLLHDEADDLCFARYVRA